MNSANSLSYKPRISSRVDKKISKKASTFIVKIKLYKLALYHTSAS